jgi:hypothetical protein
MQVSTTEEQVPPLSVENIRLNAIDFKELLFPHTDLIFISLMEMALSVSNHKKRLI